MNSNMLCELNSIILNIATIAYDRLLV